MLLRLLAALLMLQLSALVLPVAGLTALGDDASCPCIEEHRLAVEGAITSAPSFDAAGLPQLGVGKSTVPDGACSDCAGGCVECRCAKVLTALAPSRTTALARESSPGDPVFAVLDAEASPRSEPSTVFRPPRPRAVV